MARKLFISFLGTGFYGPCTYFDDKGSYTRTRFIQQATLEQIGARVWAKPDAVRFFVTEKAFEENWDKSRKTRPNRNGEVEPYIRLEEVIGGMHLQADVKAVTGIPVGNSTEEMWEIFGRVYDEMEEGDELYIDLTHAFRYLPMLVLVLSNYAKFLKNVTVRHLSYGNYEGRDKDGRAPIVDLLPLTKLQDWTTVAADFLNNGYADGLQRMAMESGAGHNDDRHDTGGVGEFADVLEKFAMDRKTCRGPEITRGDMRQRLHDISRQMDASDIPPLKFILQHIRERVTPPANTLEMVVGAAEWCYDKQLWQQSLSILQEGIVTFFCRRHGIDPMDRQRDLVNRAFMISATMAENRKDRMKWGVDGHDNLPMMLELVHDPLVADREVRRAFQEISKLRNNYMHAGYSRAHAEVITGEDIEDKIERIKLFLLPRIDEAYEPFAFQEKVLVNLSHHASSQWDARQREAAAVYGQVADVDFPAVPPDATTEDVEKIARATVKGIFKTYDDTVDLTVHVMGEMTLTCRMVTILKKAGIRCIASCTERRVEERGDGSRLSHFCFVQFREY